MTSYVVQTVTGPVEPRSLGCVMTHEHLLHSLPKAVLKKSLPDSLSTIRKDAITLENLGWIQQYPYSFDVNLRFDDEPVNDAVLDEMKYFKLVGGGTVVDASSYGLRTKFHASSVKKISEESGISIVLGTGESNTLAFSILSV